MAQEYKSSMTGQEIEDALRSVKDTGLDRTSFMNAMNKANNIYVPPQGVPPDELLLNLKDAATYALSTVYRETAFNAEPQGVNSTSGDSATLVGVRDAANADVANTFNFVLPYCVVIGDSIAEGHASLDGQLHNDVGAIEIGYPSQPGQPSYEFGRNYNMPTINNGIGSQTMANIIARWDRDVLAAQDDASGVISLPFGGVKPHVVYLHVGANDIASTPLQDLLDGYLFCADSCVANNIKLLVANVGANSWDAAGAQKCLDIDTYLKTTFSSESVYYGKVEVVDYLNWSSGGTDDPQVLKAGGYMSGIHPTLLGYTDYGKYMLNNIKMQLKIEKISLSSLKDPAGGTPSKLCYATEVTVNGNTHTLEYYGDANVNLNEIYINVQDFDSAIMPLNITKTVPRTGFDGVSGYAGFSGGTVTLDNAYVYVPVTEEPAKTSDLSNNTGTTGNRPTLTAVSSRVYFDIDLGIPIWFNGTDWVDAAGTIV